MREASAVATELILAALYSLASSLRTSLAVSSLPTLGVNGEFPCVIMVSNRAGVYLEASCWGKNLIPAIIICHSDLVERRLVCHLPVYPPSAFLKNLAFIQTEVEYDSTFT